MKKIEFIPISEFAENILSKPEPATKYIPEWYSKMDLFLDGDSSYGIAPESNTATNVTMKACSPFLDSLSFGYIWSLPLDLEIRKNFNGFKYSFRWMTEGEFITDHSKNQHPGLPSAFNGNDFVMKFSFYYRIKTPPGYSTFFTHPINRNDLPFRTFSGIVDTDTYTGAVQFPFQMMEIKDDIFILSKNTPVCQFFPFKRDNWISKLKKRNELEERKQYFDFKSSIKRPYKKNFWVSKKFK